MHRLLLILLIIISFGVAACSDNGGQQLLETAQFEEKQHNLDHAKKLYQEILNKYPDTGEAQKAQTRLDALK